MQKPSFKIFVLLCKCYIIHLWVLFLYFEVLCFYYSFSPLNFLFITYITLLHSFFVHICHARRLLYYLVCNVLFLLVFLMVFGRMLLFLRLCIFLLVMCRMLCLLWCSVVCSFLIVLLMVLRIVYRILGLCLLHKFRIILVLTSMVIWFLM